MKALFTLDKSDQLSFRCAGGECNDGIGCGGWLIVPVWGVALPCLHECHKAVPA